MSSSDAVREELTKLINAKDGTSLGYFLSEHEDDLSPEEFENALEMLQNLMEDDEDGEMIDSSVEESREGLGLESMAVEQHGNADEEGSIVEENEMGKELVTSSQEETNVAPTSHAAAVADEQHDHKEPRQDFGHSQTPPSPTELKSGQKTPDFHDELYNPDNDQQIADDFDAQLSSDDDHNFSRPSLAAEAHKIQQEEDQDHLETKELVEAMRRKRIKSLMGGDKRPGFLAGVASGHSRKDSVPTDEDLTELSQLSDEDHSYTGTSPGASKQSPLHIETALGTLTITDHAKVPSDDDDDTSAHDQEPPHGELDTSNLPEAEDAAYFETIREEFKRHSFHYMQSNTPLDDYHPLIGKFNLLLVSFNLHLYNTSNIVYISSSTPNLIDILNHLSILLCHRTKMSVFGNTKNLLQIISRLTVVKEEMLLHNFESIPFIRTMSEQKIQQKIILFLQYLLQKQKLMDVVVDLCNSASVLSDSYEKDSIMNDYNHCHQLVQFLLPKLTVHLYQFDFPPSIDDSTAKRAMVQLQSFMKAMIHYIHAQQSTKKAIESICNESDNAYIGTLFRNTICRSLTFILQHNKVKTRWLRQIHLWDIIQHMSNTHQEVQCNGIEVSTAVLTINEVVPLIDNGVLLSDSRQLHLDDKCIVFFCYCMNYKMLSFVLDKFFKDDSLAKKFYKKGPTMHRNEIVQRELMKYVGVLEKLPLSFKLRI